MPHPEPSRPDPMCADHLFQPGHVQTARNMAARGWPQTYVAVCVLCGGTVDLLALHDHVRHGQFREPTGRPTCAR